MLYVPLVVGVAVAGKVRWTVALLLLSITLFFISRESLLLWWRSRARGREDREARTLFAAYLLAAAMTGAPLLLYWKLYWLIPMGIFGTVLLMVNARQATRMEDRSIAGELTAIAGLTLSSPAGYYAARGSLDGPAAMLWAFNFLYFASSVFYIKHRIYSLNPRKLEDRKKICRISIAYHTALLTGLIILPATGSLNLLAAAAFVPAIVRSLWRIARPAEKVDLTRAGFLELAHSLLFLVLITLSFAFA